MTCLAAKGVEPGASIEIGSREGVCAAAGAGLAIIALDEVQDGFGISGRYRRGAESLIVEVEARLR